MDCALSATGADNCITAEGAADADLLVVTRLPLTDKLRVELNDHLKSAGIDVSRVAVTSVTKCRNWDVSIGKTEINACRKHLEA